MDDVEQGYRTSAARICRVLCVIDIDSHAEPLHEAVRMSRLHDASLDIVIVRREWTIFRLVEPGGPDLEEQTRRPTTVRMVLSEVPEDVRWMLYRSTHAITRTLDQQTYQPDTALVVGTQLRRARKHFDRRTARYVEVLHVGAGASDNADTQAAIDPPWVYLGFWP